MYKTKDGLVYDVVSYAKRSDGEENKEAKFQISLKITAKIWKDNTWSELFSFKVELESVEYRHCGFIQFKYTLSERDYQRFNDIKDTVYHQIKSHFHQHYHHTEDESMLKGFYSDQQIDLTESDNKVLSFYIRQIHQWLSQQVEQMHDEYVFVVFEEHTSDQEQKEVRKEFYANCENLLGQFVFYNSLLNSKRNKSCRIPPLTDNPNYDLQRLAHNIFNLMAALRAIYRKSQSAFYLNNIHETIDLQKAIKEVSESNAKLNQYNNKLAAEIKKTAKNNSEFSQANQKLIDEVKTIAKANHSLSESNSELIKKIDASIKSSDRSNKISIRLGVWSVILGCISLGPITSNIFQGCTDQQNEKTTVISEKAKGKAINTVVQDSVSPLRAPAEPEIIPVNPERKTDNQK